MWTAPQSSARCTQQCDFTRPSASASLQIRTLLSPPCTRPLTRSRTRIRIRNASPQGAIANEQVCAAATALRFRTLPCAMQWSASAHLHTRTAQSGRTVSDDTWTTSLSPYLLYHGPKFAIKSVLRLEAATSFPQVAWRHPMQCTVQSRMQYRVCTVVVFVNYENDNSQNTLGKLSAMSIFKI